jgi:hypothetical protein
VMFGAIIYYMKLFDLLVGWEYQNHRDQWERDGKPDGFFWRGAECIPRSSGLAKKRLDVKWLFKTPDWAVQNTKCRFWLMQRRCIAAAVAVGILSVLAKLLLTRFMS